MTKKIALFAGSFDPFTMGHYDTVKRASQLFDELIIGVATNTTKKPLFTADEKRQLIVEAIEDLKNVSVVLQTADLTVHFAHEVGANYLLRGIRNTQDYEYEKQIASMNKKLAPDIETIFLFASDEFSNVSSTIVKEIATFSDEITNFVPVNVAQAMKKKRS